MKAAYSRQIDALGRVVIPKQIRKELGIRAGDSLHIESDGNPIYIEHEDFCKKYVAKIGGAGYGEDTTD